MRSLSLINFDDYTVDEYGNVYTKIYHRTLKQFVDGAGYHRVFMSGHRWYLHRVVAHIFVPKIKGKTEVNHIDGNKSNNHFSNLEWTDRHGNMRHAHQVLKVRKDSLADLVPEIKSSYSTGGCSQQSLADKYGVSQITIWRIINNQTYRYA